MNEYRRCRFCGAVVIFDDARRVTAHAVPACEGWNKLFAQAVAAGLVQPLSPELHEVPDDLPTTSTFAGLASPNPGGGKKDDD